MPVCLHACCILSLREWGRRPFPRTSSSSASALAAPHCSALDGSTLDGSARHWTALRLRTAMDGSGQLWTAVVRMLDSCCTCVCAISTYIFCSCMLICAMGMCTIVLVPACAWRAPCLSKCHAREAAERTSGCRRECESMCAVCLHAIETIAHRPIFVKHTSSGVLLHAHRVHTVHKYICVASICKKSVERRVASFILGVPITRITSL